ncbi:MAG: extracellular solute-binding protein [Prevotellaceae bacterium]|jgi:spermidine/putrescine-binding protein|nr:extracellular solute-binding protein [Prevotellaceae bacterium]
MKKIFFLIAALVVLFSGCAKKELTLTICVWDDYVDAKLVAEFERKYARTIGEQLSVKVVPFNGYSEALSLLKGGFDCDLICLTENMVRELRSHNLLQPIDHSLIVPLEAYQPWIIEAMADADYKCRFTVPYNYGAMGIAFNTAKLENVHVADMQSWSVLWNPKYTGAIQMKRSDYELMSVGLLYLNRDSLLEASDRCTYPPAYHKELTSTLYDYSPEKVNEVMAALREQRQYVMGYFDGTQNRLEFSLNRGGSIAIMWSCQAANVMDRNRNVEFIIPREGSVLFIDSWAIPAAATHRDAAYAFLRFMAQPDVARRNMMAKGLPSPIKAVSDAFLQELSHDNGFFAGKTPLWRRMYFDARFLSKETFKKCCSAKPYSPFHRYLDEQMATFWKEHDN